MFLADSYVLRIVPDRARGQDLIVLSLHLGRRQSRSHNFVAVGESYFTSRDLADLSGQSIINLVSNDQEPDHGAIGAGAEINRLNKSLVEMMLAEPPVARVGLVFVERLPEVFFRVVPREPRSFRVHGDHVAAAVDQNEQIAAAAGVHPDLLRGVLDGTG